MASLMSLKQLLTFYFFHWNYSLTLILTSLDPALLSGHHLPLSIYPGLPGSGMLFLAPISLVNLISFQAQQCSVTTYPQTHPLSHQFPLKGGRMRIRLSDRKSVV